MITYNEGRYTITMKDGTEATVYLTKTEAKTLMSKLVFLRLLKIESVEYNTVQ